MTEQAKAIPVWTSVSRSAAKDGMPKSISSGN
jgi:hypothetical protein